MKNLEGLKWTGDLSLQDADILASYASRSKAILEFGCGGSTQILAQLCSNVVSVETSPEWIQVVTKRLSNIDTAHDVKFTSYGNIPARRYDMVFVDGVKERRLSFAMQTWEYLAEGGVMIFHDTKKQWGIELLKQVFCNLFNEIGIVHINKLASDGKQSNMTVIQKRIQQPYVCWHDVEGKPLWAYGSDMNVFNVWEYKPLIP